MFPTPVQKAGSAVRIGYQILLPAALVVWLFPRLGVAVTSIRPAGDFAAGNYFGMPSYFAGFENYGAVFHDSPIGLFILNSFKITIPTVIGAVGLSCLTGFALANYKFKANLWIFFLFVAGNFVPAQILMVPVRDLMVRTGLYDSIYGLIPTVIAVDRHEPIF